MNQVTEDLFESLQDKNEQLLKNKRLSRVDRAVLENQQYTLMIINSDHQKVEEMYPFYKNAEKQKDEQGKFIDKIKSALIPIALSIFLGFVTEFLYFFFVLVPRLESLK